MGKTGPITGTFIDEITYDIPSSNWTKEQWSKDFDNMLDLGIDSEKYNDNYKMLCDYAFENFADKENNEWYGYLHYDNTPSTYIKGNIFKGPFHLPRMLMILVELNSLGSIEKI